jgi:putative membrane protein
METRKACLLMMLTVFFTLTTFAQKDAKKEADKQNEKKFEGHLEDDAEFVVMAFDGGMFEVQAGKLVQANASSVKVDELASRIIMDHSKANEQLKELASKKNITVPTELSAKAQKKYDQLSKLKGAEFDKEYAKQMVSDHKKDIEAFQKEADKGKDQDIKAWAAEKLPELKQHLSLAESTVNALQQTAKK